MSVRAITRGDTVYVTNPSPRHSHMAGARGQAVEIRAESVLVSFLGGAGWFDASELSKTPAPGGAAD